MSRRDSLSTCKGPLVNKLKEGLQEAVVFLRTLGDFKIPAVIERRRKELLDKLCLLQGDTIRDTPPVIEPMDDSPLKPPPPSTQEAKDKEEKEDTPSSTSSAVTSPSHGGKLTKRDSKVINRVKDYETIHYAKKKEEESETPKRFVQLKKVAKPTDFPSTSRSRSSTPAVEGEEKAAAAKDDSKDSVEKDGSMDTLGVKDLEGDGASSVEEGVDAESDGEEEGKGRNKKKKKSKLPAVFKNKKKREKSPAPERKHPPAESTEELAESGSQQKEVGGSEEGEHEMEEGVKMFGILERKLKKGLGGHKKVKLAAKVHNTTLVLGGKNDLELANCSVEATELGFELTHPQHSSGITFKVEGSEEEKQKWVQVLKEVIAEATPPEDKKEEAADEVNESPQHEDVPSITVEEVPSQPNKANKRESKAFISTKPERKLPDQGVALKGYIHRKRPGLTRSWEKTYCVLTYQALYFTTMQDTKDYSSMLSIYPDSEGKLSETKKGKGHDKHSQVPGLALKLGKKMEHFSFESQTEFRDWKDAIERVLGIGGVEELLSEDEEIDGSVEPGEDLYEELETDFIPPIPDSPRPSRPNIPPVSQADDFLIDEDIYEETDDFLPTMPLPQSPQHAAPSLPDRNPSKKLLTSPPPSLPPRSAPSASPGLPPRNASSKTASHAPRSNETTNAANKKPVAKPAASTPAAEDDELYDDVIVGQNDAEIDELYDDVVAQDTGEAPIEEDMYDDVVATTTGVPISDEFYEDMAHGSLDYVTMEKKEEEPEPGEELYVDVDEPVAQSPSLSRKSVTQSPSLAIDVQKSNSKGTGTFSRIFNKRGSSGTKLSGMVSYKAPKKSKFDDKWAVIEGSSVIIYKSSTDKRSQDKIALGECRLELGSTEAGAGKFAFHLSKGEKVYHFSLKEATDLEDWVTTVKGLVKYAPVEAKGGGDAVASDEQETYQAMEDHIADTDEEITFKKGTYIRLISKDSASLWVGQIGTEEQVFEGKTGKFPANKVELAEDLYCN